jgi:hypothetical protein
MSPRRLLAAWGITAVFAGVAAASPPKLHALTEEYAQKNNLPIRVVRNDLGVRQIEREFVPVLPTTHESFVEHFQLQNGGIIWRMTNDAVHPSIAIQPGKNFAYHSPIGRGWPVPGGDGFYLTLAVNAEEVTHWEGFLSQYVRADQPMRYGTHHFRMPGTNNGYGSCMWWLVHGELAPGLNLATAMGVRRAKGPEILAPRLIHAGNERVGPIGVAVNTIEQFNQMTDEQLMGPEPAGGAAEQVKE